MPLSKAFHKLLEIRSRFPNNLPEISQKVSCSKVAKKKKKKILSFVWSDERKGEPGNKME